ncbi:hypothetical protein SAG0170_07500 [Streptococcus agalactiae LDS 617]|nr:hypothetical protein SAG0170_07500 [Streptococcus agalactiae LDS 617]
MKRKAISKKTRQLVLEKYNCHCAYCGKVLDIKTLRVDHLESIRNGGADDISNLIPARTDTKYWHDYIFGKATDIRFLKGRLKFTINGKENYPAPFPSAVIIY